MAKKKPVEIKPESNTNPVKESVAVATEKSYTNQTLALHKDKSGEWVLSMVKFNPETSEFGKLEELRRGSKDDMFYYWKIETVDKCFKY